MAEKNESHAAQLDRQDRNEITGAEVKSKPVRKGTKSEEKAKSKAEKILVETREALMAAQAKVEQERQARVNAENTLTKTQEALAAAHSKLEQERQARVKTEGARANAETPSEETRMTVPGFAETVETPAKILNDEGTERRVSFIVRLTVDERSEPRRIEIEHTQTRKKESFRYLDGERLAAFMKSYLSNVTTAHSLASETPPRQTFNLAVSDVRVFRTGNPGTMALKLSPEEAFVVQARFQLQSSDAISLSGQESVYEMMVYANKIASSESKLLTTYSGSLVNDALENTVQTEVPGLSPGMYRLVTLVTLRTPIAAAGHHEGPIVQVN
ncbi:MAG TPA: hypothetical protein VK897_14670 [Anaerolineales bacterium]|nr:hypothetical protein [Anaerolineales bacterium]